MPLWLDCGFPVLSNMQAGHIVVCTLFVSVDKELTDEGLKVLFNIATKELFWPDLRVTLDDKGDYLLIKNIINNLYPDHGNSFKAIDVISYLKKNIHLLELTKKSRVSEAPYQFVADGPSK